MMMNSAATAAASRFDPSYPYHMKAKYSYHDAYQRCESDTQEVAGFLLSLKHRSVTPEPLEAPEPTHSLPMRYPPMYGYPAVPAYDAPSSYMPKQHRYEAETVYSSYERSHRLLEEPLGTTDFDWESLLCESKLVSVKDRDLVPDSLFVAMAQMKRCQLTEADRVGCYKMRDIGFTGFCCKHCGGQPGFGKYFPASVRSLAQTTTSQTILKHVGNKCRFCPPHIRQAVQELQRQQAAREGTTSGRPRYGSRKIFFQRIWGRLHGSSAPDSMEDDTRSVDEGSSKTPSDIEEESTTNSLPEDAEDEDDNTASSASSSLKRKSRFGVLPTQKNKRRKTSENREPKRARHE